MVSSVYQAETSKYPQTLSTACFLIAHRGLWIYSKLLSVRMMALQAITWSLTCTPSTIPSTTPLGPGWWHLSRRWQESMALSWERKDLMLGASYFWWTSDFLLTDLSTVLNIYRTYSCNPTIQRTNIFHHISLIKNRIPRMLMMHRSVPTASERKGCLRMDAMSFCRGFSQRRVVELLNSVNQPVILELQNIGRYAIL